MKPFLLGKKTLTLPALRLPNAPMASVHRAGPVAHPDHPESAASPAVEIIKEGDKVVRLIVTCGCGEKIEVDCLYSAGS